MYTVLSIIKDGTGYEMFGHHVYVGFCIYDREIIYPLLWFWNCAWQVEFVAY